MPFGSHAPVGDLKKTYAGACQAPPIAAIGLVGQTTSYGRAGEVSHWRSGAGTDKPNRYVETAGPWRSEDTTVDLLVDYEYVSGIGLLARQTLDPLAPIQPASAVATWVGDPGSKNDHQERRSTFLPSSTRRRPGAPAALEKAPSTAANEPSVSFSALRGLATDIGPLARSKKKTGSPEGWATDQTFGGGKSAIIHEPTGIPGSGPLSVVMDSCGLAMQAP